MDIIIRNGVVIDGTGGEPYKADIGVSGGRIEDMAPGLAASAPVEIDASGLIVAPGFIDMHTHSDFSLLLAPKAESRIMQGVTTEVLGNCGGSPAPVPRGEAEGFWQYVIGLGGLYEKHLSRDEWKWETLSEFCGDLEKRGVAVNMAPLVGHSTLRSTVMGYENRPPGPDEMAQMKKLLERELEQGVFGLSTGLIYHPGAFAETSELTELAKVVAARGGMCASHIRSEGKFLFEALDEALEIAEKSGVSFEVSHFKCETPRRWGRGADLVERIDRTRARGVNVSYDQYPYPAFHSGMLEIFPTWAKEKGTDRMLAALRDRETRKKVADGMINPDPAWDNPMDGLGWDKVLLVGFRADGANSEFEGLSIEDISHKRGLSPLETALTVFEEENGRLGMIVFSMNEDDIETIMAYPDGMIGSDGGSVSPTGPTGVKKVHPRYYGTFARVLGRYCRERKLIDLPLAVRKMTGLTAEKLGLKDRGRLQKGFCADITVFDEQEIVDRADFSNPHQYAAGIHYVLVNGVVVVDKGRHTGRLPGRLLSR